MSELLNEQLKPCPFCGVAPEINFHETNYPVTAWSMEYIICCCKCGIKFIEHVPGYEQFYPKEHERAKRKLIKRWNNRGKNV